jgi:hypothetical protein
VIHHVRFTEIRIDDIIVLPRRRRPTEAQIEVLQKSLRENGLLTPISIRIPDHLEVDGRTLDGQPVLVFGAARLEAAKAEGWEKIKAEIVTGSEIDFLKSEIAENLHRAELTALEWDEQLAAYEQLLRDEANAGAQAKRDRGDAGELSAASGREKVGHRPKGSTSPTSRRTAAAELGVDEKALRRAGKVAALSSEAKDAAHATGLDKNHRALLVAAEETTPAKQVAKLYLIAEHRRDARRPIQSSDTSLSTPPGQSDGIADGAALILAAWRGAAAEAKLRAIHELGDELHDIYQQLASRGRRGVRQNKQGAPSPTRSASASRSHDLKARQYELNLRGAHSAGRDATMSLQHAN